jgi:RNA polymerase sigma-70 factor (ECF subfamily)
MTITVTRSCLDKPAEIAKEEGALKDRDFSYDRFIRPNEGQMTRVVWRIVRDPEDAEDTLQDALSTIWKKRGLVCVHPNPRALILKICINAAYDTLRKRSRRRKHEEPTTLHLYTQQEDKPGLTHSLAASHTGALDKLVQKETEGEILEAIGRLPRKQAVAVLMRIVREQPYEVIAQAMGCSESTVRIHVARGRARLNKWLAHLNPHPPGEVSK